MHNGLSNEQVVEQRKKYGSNALTKTKTHGFFHLLLESLGDPIIKILLVALAIKVVFLFQSFDWFETLGILIAIFLASFISTVSEYGSEAAFKRLQEESSEVKVKVKRNNRIEEVLLEEVVVLDTVLLQSGDKIPADGHIIEGVISVDESMLNGESKERKKYAASGSMIMPENKVYRGSVVYSGEALMISDVVGDATLYGKLAQEVQESPPESPLKSRLRDLAKVISRIGYIGAFFVTFSYLFSVLVIQNHFDSHLIWNTLCDIPTLMHHLIYALTLSVTIIVVAVPEGLPMMITLVLSSNMKRMLKSNVLVRKLVGIETTGSMNVLLTDKTGTLTKGILEVNSYITPDGKEFKTWKELASMQELYNSVYKCVVLNNGSTLLENKNVIGGNSTDRALLKFFSDAKQKKEPILKRIEFSSETKYSAITLQSGYSFIKGASEILLPKCTSYIDSSMKEKPLLQRKLQEQILKEHMNKGERVISLAYKRGSIEDGKIDNLIFLGFIGIKDELRKEAIQAVDTIQKAGISMVMITGDAKETALQIAKEVGLLKKAEDLVITSEEMALYSDEQLKEKVQNLKVVARALPQDKSRLVRIFQEKNCIVGMTGDGVNDAPALKKANVGFAMGSGTEVSKEASDIVILDDNINSISKAILYGRTIFKSIRKFIIYQLTCNMCALFLSIVGPFIGVNTPITIIQMLWINMIMDTFAGLAFSFEPALIESMQEKPKSIHEPIMNFYMWSEILFTGFYSACLCIFFLKAPVLRHWIRVGENDKFLMTAYFALFIFIGICNAFNARTDRLNLLAHIKENKVFLGIFLFILSVQIYLIYHGGDLFRTYGLYPKEFFLVVLLSLTVIPVDFCRKRFLRKRHLCQSV